MSTLRPSPDALLNPCIDPIFKALFTQQTENSRIALTEFLSAVLQKEISNVQLEPNELPIENEQEKQSRFDLTCMADGEPINVEMQGVNVKNSFGSRSEYHCAHLMNHYVKRGAEYWDIPKVYQISVLNFNYTPGENSVSHFVMKDDAGNSLGSRMNIIFIELPKINKLPDDVEKLTNIELWGKFFLEAKNNNKSDFIKSVTCKNRGINSAMCELTYLSQDEAQWIREYRHEKYLMDEYLNRKYAIEEGLKEGLKEGLEKGLKEGRSQGEQSKALADAVLMITKYKLPLEEVCKDLGVDKTMVNEELSKVLIAK